MNFRNVFLGVASFFVLDAIEKMLGLRDSVLVFTVIGVVAAYTVIDRIKKSKA
ncbi:MAG: hypothetical protein N4A76_03410 [Firmicutes bacterium]|jgi:hypothetical protein|nr:hypothetical protein [Bacillota bacterium]